VTSTPAGSPRPPEQMIGAAPAEDGNLDPIRRAVIHRRPAWVSAAPVVVMALAVAGMVSVVAHRNSDSASPAEVGRASPSNLPMLTAESLGLPPLPGAAPSVIDPPAAPALPVRPSGEQLVTTKRPALPSPSRNLLRPRDAPRSTAYAAFDASVGAAIASARMGAEAIKSARPGEVTTSANPTASASAMAAPAAAAALGEAQSRAASIDAMTIVPAPIPTKR